MLQIGDSISVLGFKGIITDVSRPIGFLAECGKGENYYTIELSNIPESKLKFKTNEPDRKDTELSEGTKG